MELSGPPVLLHEPAQQPASALARLIIPWEGRCVRLHGVSMSTFAREAGVLNRGPYSLFSGQRTTLIPCG